MVWCVGNMWHGLFVRGIELMGGVSMGKSTGMQVGTAKETAVQPLLLTIPQVMRCMSLGRNKVYDLIQKEGLPVVRFGRAVRISHLALQQWLEQRERSAVE